MLNSGEDVALEVTGKLLEMNIEDGKLKVNFSEKLVILIREVRQMSELGFKIDVHLMKSAEIGSKF